MSDEKKMRLSPEHKGGVFGKILSRIAMARYHTKQLAQEELWRRNGAGNPKHRKGWKMEEVVHTGLDGTEIIEFRLYKLTDRAVIAIKSEISTTTDFGLAATEEEQADGPENNNPNT